MGSPVLELHASLKKTALIKRFKIAENVLPFYDIYVGSLMRIIGYPNFFTAFKGTYFYILFHFQNKSVSTIILGNSMISMTLCIRVTLIK